MSHLASFGASAMNGFSEAVTKKGIGWGDHSGSVLAPTIEAATEEAARGAKSLKPEEPAKKDKGKK